MVTNIMSNTELVPIWILHVTSYREDDLLASAVALTEAHAHELAKELIIELDAKYPRRRTYHEYTTARLREAWDSGNVYELIKCWNALGTIQVDCVNTSAYVSNGTPITCPI